MCASPDMVGVPGGSSFGPPNGEPRSVKFNVVKGLLSTLIEFGGVLEGVHEHTHITSQPIIVVVRTAQESEIPKNARVPTADRKLYDNCVNQTVRAIFSIQHR